MTRFHERSWRVSAWPPLALLGLLCFASPAVAVPPLPTGAGAVTSTASKPLAAGAVVRANAVCPRHTLATGGGFSVTPLFDPHGTTTSSGGIGPRSLVQGSRYLGSRTWRVTASSFSATAPTGTLSAFARCLPQRRLPLAHISQLDEADPGEVAASSNLCNGAAIGGGYGVPDPFEVGDPSTSQLLPLGSWEAPFSSVPTWEALGINDGAAETTMFSYGICARTLNGRTFERTASAPVADNDRTAATARCPKTARAVSGGFLVSPRDAGLEVSVDVNRPKGKRLWSAGLFEFSDDPPPPGTTLTAYAYCLNK